MARIKAFFLVALLFLGLGLVGIVSNIISGFQLSKDRSAAPDEHLAIALSSLVLIGVGLLGCLRLSQKCVESAQRRFADNPNGYLKEVLLSLRVQRETAVQWALSALSITLISFITGTISHAGRFPWIHGILGFALVTTLLIASIFWVR